jgi:hypothetical protein
VKASVGGELGHTCFCGKILNIRGLFLGISCGIVWFWAGVDLEAFIGVS